MINGCLTRITEFKDNSEHLDFVFFERRIPLKRILSALLAIIPVLAILFTSPAYAADAAAGGQVFSANCAACHAGGKNLVNPAKTLSKADLESNGMNSAAAIVTQVTNGKNAMPAFGGRLSADQIDNVAAYVLEQSSAGW